MKIRKIAAASLAAVLTVTNVAVVANADVVAAVLLKSVVKNDVRYKVLAEGDTGEPFFNAYPENTNITEAVILPKIDFDEPILAYGGRKEFTATNRGGIIGFGDCTNLTKIVIPHSVKLLNPYSFGWGQLTKVKDIYYEGTQEEWEELCKPFYGNYIIEYTTEGIKVAEETEGYVGHTPFENCKNLKMHYNYQYTAADYGDYVPGDNSSTATTNKTYTPTVSANGADEETKSILNGITVTDRNGAFPDGVVMSVTAKGRTETSFSFDITFTKDGAEVQPSRKVTVKVPLPEAFKGGNVCVYHGSEYIKSTVKGNYVVFETDEFSVYTLSIEKLTEQDPGATEPGATEINSTPETNNTDSSAETPNKGNPNTGIALAIAPVILAGAAVVVLKKKR